MIAVGIVLLLIGLLVPMHVLTVIGLVLLVVGLVVNFVPLGGTRRRVW